MASNISDTGINSDFPIAGQDNDSQGFRDNFTTIKANFVAAKTEIESIQTNGAVKNADNNFLGNTINSANFQNTTEFDGSKNLSLQPNFGVGFVYNGIQIDYALTNIGSVGNALFSNIFSVKIDYSFFRR